MKIFPRNLTARADYVVRGNPANSRPESGVDNCYPGLEFDQRNLEQRFFPGLVFEFHRSDGAVVVAPPDGAVRDAGLTADDVARAQPLYLWYLLWGAPGEPQLVDVSGTSGIEAWERVRDIEPGTVTIALGPGAAPTLDSNAALTRMHAAHGNADASARTSIARDDAGVVTSAVFSAERAAYLIDGVIDVEAYAPGDLTKTMCAPWIYDFHDCFCYYWASNKPDLVASSDGRGAYLDFMRTERDADPPVPDATGWFERAPLELSQAAMIEGWRRLPIVVNDRETMPRHYLTHAQALAEIGYLATVEHALLVEYVYAMYSLAVPANAPRGGSDPVDEAVLGASQLVLGIAIDEMRHFLWANQLLKTLGGMPSTGRATELDAAPTPQSGRKIFPDGRKHYTAVPFALDALTPERLQFFIEMEARSRVVDEGIDGMYVELLRSVRDQPPLFPAHEKLIPTIKLIIDEGERHHTRFLEIRALLAPLPRERYLRVLGPPRTAIHQQYLDLCDAYYHTALDAVAIGFALDDVKSSAVVRDAVRSMRSLDDVAQLLARDGVAPQFGLGSRADVPIAADDAAPLIDSRAQSHADAVNQLARSDSDEARDAARRHGAVGDALFTSLAANVSDAGAAT